MVSHESLPQRDKEGKWTVPDDAAGEYGTSHGSDPVDPVVAPVVRHDSWAERPRRVHARPRHRTPEWRDRHRDDIITVWSVDKIT